MTQKFTTKAQALWAALLALSLLAPGIAWAQEEDQQTDQPETIDLSGDGQDKSSKTEKVDIVITGSKKERVYKNAPVATRLVGKKQMKARGDTNLFQALRATTGVVPQNNCQNCNFDGVRLNGLDSKYNQILLNSIPLISPLAEVYFYQSFPEALIDRVEVVKGGGSALYGGGAVGGVVNILLRKPKTDLAEIGHHHSFINGEVPDTYTHFLASRVSEDGKMGMSTFGSLNYGRPYDHNDDGFSEISKQRGASLGATGYISPFADAELTYLLLYNHDDRDGGNAFDKEDYQAGLREGVAADLYVGILKWDHRVNKRLAYSLYSSASYMERKAYYGGNEGYDSTGSWGTEDTKLGGYSQTDNPLAISGVDVTYTVAQNHDIMVGVSHSYEKLEDRQTGLEIQNTYKYTDTGSYIQYDGKLFDILQLVAGLRVDKHNQINDAILSPRANLLVHIADNLQWRAAYTTGFSAPRIYVEDFHLTVIDGDAQRVENADDLKPEKSQSVNTSFSWQVQAMGFLIDMSPGFFYTDLQDSFTMEEHDTDPNIRVRKNTSGAEVMGGEFDISAQSKNLDVSLGFSYQQSEYKEAQEVFSGIKEKTMLRAPQMTGNLTAIYELHPITLSTDLVLHGPMKTPHETTPENEVVTTDIFYEWGARVGYDFYQAKNTSWEIFAGVKNILNEFQEDLDKGYGRDAGYVYGPALPRTFYLGIHGRM